MMEKYKVTITVELIKPNESTFASNLIEKIKRQEEEKIRINENNQKIIQALKEIMIPHVNELIEALKPLDVIVSKPREWFEHDRYNRFTLSYDFGYASDGSSNFVISLPCRRPKIGDTFVSEIIWDEPKIYSKVSNYMKEHSFTTVEDMLNIHADQIEKAYRYKLKYSKK